MLGVTPVDAEFAPEDRTAGDRPRCEPPPCTWWWDEEDLPPFDPDELREGDIDWDHLLDEARAQHAATVGGGTAGETRPAPSAQRHRLEDVLVPGVGVIPAAEVAALTRAVGTKVTRALTDPATGTVIETMTGAYRPTGAIRRLVMARDEHCRFPVARCPPAGATWTMSSPGPTDRPPPTTCNPCAGIIIEPSTRPTGMSR
jgi:hypothetical protein